MASSFLFLKIECDCCWIMLVQIFFPCYIDKQNAPAVKNDINLSNHSSLFKRSINKSLYKI